MIPEGHYKARGIDAALGRAGTGTEQVAVLLEITEGEYSGHQFTWYGYFTDGTIKRTFESLRHLGWEGDDLTDLSGYDANEVTIVIKHEPDKHGELHARVQWINGPGGLAMKERLDDVAARAFAQRMKGAAIASRSKMKSNGASARPAAPAPAPAASHAGNGGFQQPGFDADDIPF